MIMLIGNSKRNISDLEIVEQDNSLYNSHIAATLDYYETVPNIKMNCVNYGKIIMGDGTRLIIPYWQIKFGGEPSLGMINVSGYAHGAIRLDKIDQEKKYLELFERVFSGIDFENNLLNLVKFLDKHNIHHVKFRKYEQAYRKHSATAL